MEDQKIFKLRVTSHRNGTEQIGGKKDKKGREEFSYLTFKWKIVCKFFHIRIHERKNARMLVFFILLYH